MTYKETLKELMNQNGTVEQFQKLIDATLDGYKNDPENSDVTEEIWAELKSEFRTVSIDDLVELVLPGYSKIYSQQELIELVNFYKSPIGTKLRDKAYELSVEIVPATQEWGKSLTKRFISKLEEKNIL